MTLQLAVQPEGAFQLGSVRLLQLDTHMLKEKYLSITRNTNMCPREGTAPWQTKSERVGTQAMCQGRVATYLPTTQSKMDSKRATFFSVCSCSLISDSGSGWTSCENASDGEQRGRKVR